VVSDLLDLDWRERPHGELALFRRLARDLGWVGGDPLPLDRPLRHPLEDRHCLADRLATHLLALEL
jgi:hypothetical protein